MNYIFIFITFLWISEFIIFPSSEKKEKSGKSSFSIILLSVLSVITINAIMYFNKILVLNNLGLKVLALIIYALGITLRYWSLILLGKNFSRDVEVSLDQDLISKGTYRYIRHPLYLGLFMLTISVPLYVGNLLLFFFSLILMFLAISIRIKEEETFMENTLGERYIKCKEKRYKFLPFIY